jgi:hypothetical protein
MGVFGAALVIELPVVSGRVSSLIGPNRGVLKVFFGMNLLATLKVALCLADGFASGSSK